MPSRRTVTRWIAQGGLLGSMGAAMGQRASELRQQAEAAPLIPGQPAAWADRLRMADRLAQEQLAAAQDPRAEVELLIPSFLGNQARRFYGRGIPQGLQVRRKFFLGSGSTRIGRRLEVWSGAGWTGQCTLVRDRGRDYLLIGAFDHHLRKIDLQTWQEVWRYRFDDVLKGTATVYIDRTAPPLDQVIVLQGSRQGVNVPFTARVVPSLRAISFRTGQELWRWNVRQTDSYSRDNDSSPLDLRNGLLFNVGENGVGSFLGAALNTVTQRDGITQPAIAGELLFYAPGDAARHGGNLVAESSPSRLGDRLFVAAGSGHIYGVDLNSRKIDWDFFTGTDIDGTAVVSRDGKLFCAIERQYTSGPGGLFKLNPARPPAEAVEWFLPTGSLRYQDWQGGIIGSAALNDDYRDRGQPPLFATGAIDGILYIGSQLRTTGLAHWGPQRDGPHNSPYVAFQTRIGPTISTPIFTEGDRLVAASYDGVRLFQLRFLPTQSQDPAALPNGRGQWFRLEVTLLAHFAPGSSFEATPIVWDGTVYLSGRDGWLYALG